METLIYFIIGILWTLIISAPTYMAYKLYEQLESYKFTKSRIEREIEMIQRDLNSNTEVSPKRIRYIHDELQDLHQLAFTKTHSDELIDFHDRVDELNSKIKKQ